MSLGRRKVGLEESSRWVFNRMADVYDARPPYPAALIDALVELARPAAAEDGRDGDPIPAVKGRATTVADVGAGIGHLALPLAERGLDVVAIEPAKLMLDRLVQGAAARGLGVRTCHAAAEKLPLADDSIDLLVIADALHFLDAELTAREIARVLRKGGALAVITCELGGTPFMKKVVKVIEGAVPRRPRALEKQLIQLAAMTRVPLVHAGCFDDRTPVDHAALDRILRSISFIGPAMNPDRLARFRARVHALSDAPVWARVLTVRAGRRPIRVVRQRAEH